MKLNGILVLNYISGAPFNGTRNLNDKYDDKRIEISVMFYCYEWVIARHAKNSTNLAGIIEKQKLLQIRILHLKKKIYLYI